MKKYNKLVNKKKRKYVERNLDSIKCINKKDFI